MKQSSSWTCPTVHNRASVGHCGGTEKIGLITSRNEIWDYVSSFICPTRIGSAGRPLLRVDRVRVEVGDIRAHRLWDASPKSRHNMSIQRHRENQGSQIRWSLVFAGVFNKSSIHQSALATAVNSKNNRLLPSDVTDLVRGEIISQIPRKQGDENFSHNIREPNS